ncbi:MAG: site-specific integrase [Alphaproteobacteria bacterium]|nr:site-specific integrase [Alphaproteobacteria bacterium]
MASIRRKGVKWQAIVRRKGIPTQSRTFNRRGDAAEWARQAELKADRRDLGQDPRVLDTLTVGTLLERYRDEVVSRKRGAAEIETYIINALRRRSFAEIPLGNLDPSVFAKYRDARLDDVSPTTVSRELALLQHAFKIAADEWQLPLPRNPLASVKKPGVNRGRERRLREGELDRLREACRVCRNPLIEPLILLAVETGMRQGEMLRIRWTDL